MRKVLCLSGSNTFAQNIMKGAAEISAGCYLVKFYRWLTLLCNRLFSVLSLEVFKEICGIQGFVFLSHQFLSCSSKKKSLEARNLWLSNFLGISHQRWVDLRSLSTSQEWARRKESTLGQGDAMEPISHILLQPSFHFLSSQSSRYISDHSQDTHPDSQEALECPTGPANLLLKTPETRAISYLLPSCHPSIHRFIYILLITYICEVLLDFGQDEYSSFSHEVLNPGWKATHLKGNFTNN